MPGTTTDATIHDIRTISQHPERFHGWPTVARRRDGELLVACSGNRQAHVCPFGKVELIRSRDDGKTWSEPVLLADGPLDDRDAGVIETSKGTILVNWFTSLAWLRKVLPLIERGERDAPENVERWYQIRDGLDEQTMRRELGGWMLRSEDGGKTWSARINTVANSPHGPTELSDGRLLYVGALVDETGQGAESGSPFAAGRLSVSESRDDGRTWTWLADLPGAPEGSRYVEPYAVEAADGRIVAQIRYHGPEHRETLQCESLDGGWTWSEPRSIGVAGFPSHLLRLRDDRLLMTYGHRYEPWGNQARVSEDHGQTWSEPIVLLGEGGPRDLG
ncbi:MAG: exo-alpha-sialidase, partial [Phycisphaeraceae bacterium]